jgi:hypothetical protein
MGVEPLTVMFVDVHARGLRTDPAAVRAVVKAHRLKMAMPSAMSLGAAFSNAAGLNDYNANWQNYEALYLSEKERAVKDAQVCRPRLVYAYQHIMPVTLLFMFV